MKSDRVIDDENVKLPFEPTKQSAILGYLITKPEFFAHARAVIDPSWFNDVRDGIVYKALLAFWDEFERAPSIDELKCQRVITREQQSDIVSLRKTIDRSGDNTAIYGLDLLQTELTEWMHARIFHELIDKSKHLFNDQKFAEAYQVVAQKIERIQTTQFENGARFKCDGIAALFEKSKEEYADACTIGLQEWDWEMSGHQSKEGCLIKGDSTVAVAPSNTGKTTMLIAVAVANLLRGKHVQLVTHEGRPDEIYRMLIRCLLRQTRDSIDREIAKPGSKDLLHSVVKYLDDHLWFLPMNGAGVTVESVGATIRQQHKEHVAKFGFGFDLLVDDYPAKLVRKALGKQTPEKRLEDEAIYNYFAALAGELGCHALLAAQTNRAGSAAGREGKRNLDNEDVAESWGIITGATNVIMMRRSDEEKKGDLVTYCVTKTRSAKSGLQVLAVSDFDRATTHREDLPHACFFTKEKEGEALARLAAQRLAGPAPAPDASAILQGMTAAAEALAASKASKAKVRLLEEVRALPPCKPANDSPAMKATGSGWGKPAYK
jgi:hypothetical protein